MKINQHPGNQRGHERRGDRQTETTETPTRIFVPITDDLLYDYPERITGPLVAYTPGHVCSHWLNIEINPADDPFALADDLFDHAAA